jgi:DNA-binding transcriptional MerR regulator
LEKFLPQIPAKRYFTISEVSNLCAVKPHVLRYWEQEFPQLRPMKRRGNRRYYQRHDVLVIRKIRDLLYDQGFTIIGARNKLQEFVQNESGRQFDEDLKREDWTLPSDASIHRLSLEETCRPDDLDNTPFKNTEGLVCAAVQPPLRSVRRELMEIRDLLGPCI